MSAPLQDIKTKPSVHVLHLEIAEAGKMAALSNNHKEALRHYREALRIAGNIHAPGIFQRHYTQCILESLELSLDFESLILICEQACEQFATRDNLHSMQKREYAAMLERLGIARLKQGDRDAALKSLTAARDMAGESPFPVTGQILKWLEREYKPDITRILRLQKQNKYFTVRRGQVDRRRSKALPTANSQQAATPPFAFGRV